MHPQEPSQERGALQALQAKAEFMIRFVNDPRGRRLFEALWVFTHTPILSLHALVVTRY